MLLNPQDHYETIVAEIKMLGELSHPNETGGLIIPGEDLPPRNWVVEMPNISDSPTDTCLFDLADLEERYRDRLAGVEDPSCVWLWHTHPGGNIGPSRMDMRNKVPRVHYLVVSLPDGVGVRY